MLGAAVRQPMAAADNETAAKRDGRRMMVSGRRDWGGGTPDKLTARSREPLADASPFLERQRGQTDSTQHSGTIASASSTGRSPSLSDGRLATRSAPAESGSA